jgi:hypothetical protein
MGIFCNTALSNGARMTEPSESFEAAKTVTIPVNPARLAWGTYDHRRNHDAGEGDIHASYSADTIATGGSVRKGFPLAS